MDTNTAINEVSDLFDIDPLCFNVEKAYIKLDQATTCDACEILCDELEGILKAVSNSAPGNAKYQLIAEIQWVALKAARKSTKLQNMEFKAYLAGLELAKANAIPSPTKKTRGKRSNASPINNKGNDKRARGGRSRRDTNTAPTSATEGENLSDGMEEGNTSDGSSSDESSTPLPSR